MVTAGAVVAFSNSTGDRIIAEIKGLKDPREALMGKPGVKPTKEDIQAVTAWAKKRDGLILDLYAAAPNDPVTATYMEQRWSDGMPMEHFDDIYAAEQGGKAPDIKAIIKPILADIDSVVAKNPPPAIKEAGLFEKAEMSMMSDSATDPMPQVNAFAADFPKSKRLPDLLFTAAVQGNVTSDEKTAALRKIAKDYPDFNQIQAVQGQLKQQDAINKPFDLKFTDAVSGKPVDIAGLKGKVVLVDFWATWCGPCVAEMPIVKDAYQKYHDKGLEIIGVSLDNPEAQGGLTSLKAFVKDHSIPWNQYYQGNGWESKFSSAWGIQSIPTMFVVDKDGKSKDPSSRATMISTLS